MIDILEKLEQGAEDCPCRIMFHSRQGEITYGELWEKSGRLAAYLEELLGENRSPVVVYGHKDPMMLVCFFALARSGRAYCPVDRTMSERRIREITGMVDSPLVLAVERFPVEAGKKKILGAEELRKAADGYERIISPEKRVRGKDLFYIIFTSGSSGKPKGVKIEAGALDSYLDWAVDFGGEERAPEGSVFLNQSSFSFDFSIMDCYTGFINHGMMWATDRDLQRDVHGLVEYLRQGHLKYWLSTPSLVEKCFQAEEFCGENFPELKLFQFCGEILSKKTVRQIWKRFPGIRIINAYGPTEGTVAVTAAPVTPDMLEDDRSIPVGRAKPGVKIEILDYEAEGVQKCPERHFLPAGQAGEIIITGNSVCPGYYREEEKTREAFFQYGDPGEKISAYHTGDMGYLTESGMLYYVSRVDKQLKYHGFRIEPGDIENNIMKIPGVARAAAVPKIEEGRVLFIAAFVIRDALSDVQPGEEDIRSGLREFLPGYMIPGKVIFLDRMPLNQNDKVNRKELEQMI